jgi:hypothetical protein
MGMELEELEREVRARVERRRPWDATERQRALIGRLAAERGVRHRRLQGLTIGEASQEIERLLAVPERLF